MIKNHTPKIFLKFFFFKESKLVTTFYHNFLFKIKKISLIKFKKKIEIQFFLIQRLLLLLLFFFFFFNIIKLFILIRLMFIYLFIFNFLSWIFY